MKLNKLQTLLLMAMVTVGAYAQTDSTAVAGSDSVVWNQTLDGVTIEAQRPLIRQDIDRVGYDVQADDDLRTATVLDMLRKVPMVTIDGEENIKVKGSANFKIYKNGHEAPSLSKNAREILKAMPASSVKRIEVITDPGAREDAEGVGAVLNIVMMDTRMMDGITGSLNGSYSSFRSAGLGAYLATQLGKTALSIDYGSNSMTRKSTANRGIVERTYLQTGNIQSIDILGTNPGYIHYADINASYDIDSLNLLSASFGGYFYKIDVQGSGDITMQDAQGSPLYRVTENYWMPSYSHHTWNGRLDYEHKTRCPGEQLTLSYMLALTRQHSEQEDSYTNRQGDVPFSYTGLTINNRERFTEHTFQADYVRPLAEGHKLEVGAKYIDRHNSSFARQDFFLPPADASSPVEEGGAETSFSHTTRIAAAYADYMLNIGPWAACTGLRYEYSQLSVRYPDGTSQPFDKHLNDWVPQASVKYQIDDSHSLKLGYTTSITRPGITYLNPAVLSTPSQVSFGNAHLVSTRQQSLNLTYMYIGRKLTLQFVPHYTHYHNGIGAWVYTEDDCRFSTYGNNLRQHRWQMEGYAQWKPFSGTTLVGNFTFTDNHAYNTDAQLSQHAASTFYYALISQQLPWKLLATAYAFGQVGHSPENIYAYARPWHRYAFTLQRSFLSGDRLTVRLMANTPFHKDMHYETRTTQGDITGWGDNISATNGRYLRLQVSYRFGRLKSGVKKTGTTIENSDEVGGIVKGK